MILCFCALGIQRTLDDLLQKYYPISKIWIGFELSILLQDPNDVEVCILSTTIQFSLFH